MIGRLERLTDDELAGQEGAVADLMEYLKAVLEVVLNESDVSAFRAADLSNLSNARPGPAMTS